MPEHDITRMQELVYELRVGDAIKDEVITVSPSTPMGELRKILRDNRISGMPVVDDGKLVGIISIEDFIGWLGDGAPECNVRERMTEDVVTVSANDPLVQAVNKLERFDFGRLAVTRNGNGAVMGVITKGDIIEDLLKKMDVDYRLAEMRNARSRYIFEDILADRTVLGLEYNIQGGDFDHAGACATALKTTLLRLGISPSVARRAAIVVYEAEMNAIFYTDGAVLSARMEQNIMRIEVADRGPGIEDVEQAMTAGFSTAPEWVRELGFGAGMGLQNIKNSADRMDLHSVVGEGSRLEIDILLENSDDVERDQKAASA